MDHKASGTQARTAHSGSDCGLLHGWGLLARRGGEGGRGRGGDSPSLVSDPVSAS